MDTSSDAVHRALRGIDGAHRRELDHTAEVIDRLYQDEAPTQDKWDLVAGGANRTSWMKVGGVAVLTSAVLAACGGGGEPAASPTTAAPPGATTTLAGGSRIDAADLNIFRFSASLENLIVAAYDVGIPLVKTPAMLAAIKLFQSHHKDHATLFNGQLKANGQKDFTEPNSVVLNTLKPQIDAMRSEADVLRFAQGLELAAASTYYSNVGVLKGEKLSYTAMTIGGTEYRHAALLAMINNSPIQSTASGFLTDREAIALTGV